MQEVAEKNLVSQPQHQYHFQATWNVVPDVNVAYDIRIQQDSRRRKSFAEKEREEQVLRAEEEILLERERRSTARLESMLEIVKTHARRDSWVKIMQQELRDALHIFPPGTRVYLRSVQLLNSVVVASRGKIAARVMMNYNPADAQRILQTILPDDWNEVYINVSVSVFQGEIR